MGRSAYHPIPHPETGEWGHWQGEMGRRPDGTFGPYDTFKLHCQSHIFQDLPCEVCGQQEGVK